MREKVIGVEGEKGVIAGNDAQTIADVKERVMLSEWQRQIEERQSGGYSIEEWCQMQGISKSSYYYRLRRVRRYLCEITGVLPETQREKHSKNGSGQQIVPLREIIGKNSVVDTLSHQSNTLAASDESKIEISCGEVKVAFKGSVEKELLQTVLEVLRSC